VTTGRSTHVDGLVAAVLVTNTATGLGKRMFTSEQTLPSRDPFKPKAVTGCRQWKGIQCVGRRVLRG
jgi:hypothetical protein